MKEVRNFCNNNFKILVTARGMYSIKVRISSIINVGYVKKERIKEYIRSLNTTEMPDATVIYCYLINILDFSEDEVRRTRKIEVTVTDCRGTVISKVKQVFGINYEVTIAAGDELLYVNRCGNWGFYEKDKCILYKRSMNFYQAINHEHRKDKKDIWREAEEKICTKYRYVWAAMGIYGFD